MRGRSIALLAIGVLACVASLTRAATATLYLKTANATPTSGTWQLYIADSQDNDGLSAFGVDVVGLNGVVINKPPTIKAPRPIDPSSQYAQGLGGFMGFNAFVNTGSNDGTGRINITAAQGTVYGATDDPTYDMGVLVGVGQESPTASPQNGSQGPWDGSGTPTGIVANNTSPWSYVTPSAALHIGGTLVEQGTYTTSNPSGRISANVDGFVEVLGTGDNGNNEPWDLVHQLGNTPVADIQPNSDGSVPANPFGDTITLVPEPTTLGLLAIGMGLAATRRRKARVLNK